MKQLLLFAEFYSVFPGHAWRRPAEGSIPTLICLDTGLMSSGLSSLRQKKPGVRSAAGKTTECPRRDAMAQENGQDEKKLLVGGCNETELRSI